MKSLSALKQWAAWCWASFQQHFALAMQLPGAQAGPWAGDVPDALRTKKSASSSYKKGKCPPADPGAIKPIRATKGAAVGSSQMGQQHQDDCNRPVRMRKCAKSEPCSSFWASEEFAEKLRQFCEAGGPAEIHKVRTKLSAPVSRSMLN